MRPALLLAAAGLFATVGAELLARAPARAPTAAVIGTATEPDAGVHPVTEADLTLLRDARPTLDGPVLGGLRLRWCVAQDRCPQEARN